MPTTITNAARRYGLSRSTLLYYDRIGLLRPARSGAGYRLYEETDLDKLENIMVFREIGIPLAEIPELLACGEMTVTPVLIKRLHQINTDIQSLRDQQEIILKLLRSSQLYRDRDKIDIADWHAILRDAGITPDAMERWHAFFEKNAPSQHGQFLSLLGLTADEIHRLRESLKGDRKE